ncbi:MAG: hypothetical protein ACLTAI_12715 [Thomasclavelia sp.]
MLKEIGVEWVILDRSLTLKEDNILGEADETVNAINASSIKKMICDKLQSLCLLVETLEEYEAGTTKRCSYKKQTVARLL